jgi:tetratricopeptide (TPR) repeat protein
MKTNFYYYFLLSLLVAVSCNNRPGVAIEQSEECLKLEKINERCLNTLRSDYKAAKPYIDSALALIQEFQCDDEAGDIYYNYGLFLMMNHKYPEAIDTLKIACNFYQHQKDSIQLSKTLGNIGVTYKRLAKYESAIAYSDTSYQLAVAMKDTVSLLNAIINKNISLLALGQDSLVIAISLSFLEMAENYADKTKLANLYGDIGTAYIDRRAWDKALVYFRKEVNIRQDNDARLGIIYNNMSTVYLGLNQLDSAFYYADKGEILKVKRNDLYGLAFAYTNKGVILRHQKKLQEALVYHQKAAQIRIEISHIKGLKESYYNISKVLQDMKRYGEAGIYLEKGIELSEEIEAIDRHAEELMIAAEFYDETKQHQKASTYYRKALEFEDSLHQMSLTKALLELEVEYQNDLLEKDKAAQAVVLQKETQKNKYLTIGLIGLAIFCAVLLYLWQYIRMKNKKIQQSNYYLNEQHQAINAINSELKNSNMELIEKHKIVESANKNLKTIKIKLKDSENQPLTIGGFTVVPNNLFYVEIRKNDLHIFHVNGEQKERIPIKVVEASLPAQFCQIHRSYIINMDNIVDFDRKEQIINLSNGTTLKLTKTYAAAFEAAYPF